MADFNPFDVMRTLLPDFEGRLSTQLERRRQYDALARRNAAINEDMQPGSRGNVQANQVSRAGGWANTGMFNGRANTEYYENNRAMAALMDKLRGGVNGSWRYGAGSVSGLRGPAIGTADPIAQLRQAAGFGG